MVTRKHPIEQGDRSDQSLVSEIYDRLYLHFGPQQWWPALSPFEVIVGAVLTQNTAWTNVEKAITQLRKAKCLTPEALMAVSEKRLATLIRSSGFYNLKTLRLKAVTAFIFKKYGGSLRKMFSTPGPALRKQLLTVKGLGPETVDSILLYAGELPFFVVDAYTRRIFSRHLLVDAKASYESLQHFFILGLPRETRIFNEYHALIVRTAKQYCKKHPDCGPCPLSTLPGFNKPKALQK